MSKLQFPPSSHTVRVRMVDTTTVMTVRGESFVKPVPPGQELLNLTDVAFLIEHAPSNKKVMFDLGCRKDYWNLPPVIQKRLGDVIPSLRVDKNTSDILQEGGIQLDSVASVIWSHYHWDHTSNVALFPASTTLVVGPGFKESPTLLPGFPEAPDSPVSASDFANRTLQQIDFSTPPLHIGGLPAHDFFGDGSFYLLDTPGHCIGHICGLARTSITPDTFVFMGGDICHFAGDFRPNTSYPLPNPIPNGVLDTSPYFPVPCSCSLFTEHHPRAASPSIARHTPWYEVTDHKRSAYVDPPTALDSVSKMQQFDESDAVLVCIAHDPTLLQILPTLNNSPTLDLNAWQREGWKEKCHWGWLNELPRDGKPGREPIVTGFWKDGKPWDRARDDLKEGGEERQKKAQEGE